MRVVITRKKFAIIIYSAYTQLEMCTHSTHTILVTNAQNVYSKAIAQPNKKKNKKKRKKQHILSKSFPPTRNEFIEGNSLKILNGISKVKKRFFF